MAGCRRCGARSSLFPGPAHRPFASIGISARPAVRRGRPDNLVIAASFLLTDAVVAAARAHPGTRFVLVDPLVATPGLPNLALPSFREDQAAYLAGALAALLTRPGLVARRY